MRVLPSVGAFCASPWSYSRSWPVLGPHLAAAFTKREADRRNSVAGRRHSSVFIASCEIGACAPICRAAACPTGALRRRGLQPRRRQHQGDDPACEQRPGVPRGGAGGRGPHASRMGRLAGRGATVFCEGDSGDAAVHSGGGGRFGEWLGGGGVWVEQVVSLAQGWLETWDGHPSQRRERPICATSHSSRCWVFSVDSLRATMQG